MSHQNDGHQASSENTLPEKDIRPFTLLQISFEKLLRRWVTINRFLRRWGRRVSFKNALIVMTSNVGSAAIAKGGKTSFGFFIDEDKSTSYAGMKALVIEELKGYFRPGVAE
ncbi:UNVERIFIED_CONTAM: Chaperone protein ClpD, chloroplastic [Sesamum angustifolium]|uniref:Chaperone protein ClpD, chloroplastic n=1 Tax=Sesamum angustifolium TaxID=2727405 RepID=A0AAW2LKQ2_9LAMI